MGDDKPPIPNQVEAWSVVDQIRRETMRDAVKLLRQAAELETTTERKAGWQRAASYLEMRIGSKGAGEL